MEDEKRTNNNSDAQFNMESGNNENDEFFAAPFVEQQNEEQNAAQTTDPDPVNETTNAALEDENPEAFPMFFPKDVGSKPDYRQELNNDVNIQPFETENPKAENDDFGKNEFGEEETIDRKNEDFGKNEFNDELGSEEFATETAIMANEPFRPLNQPEDERPDENRIEPETAVTQNAAMGWLALTLAIASLFFWPAILGPAAAIIGFFALTRGNRALGIWSIVIGLISFMAYIVLVPLYI